MAYILTWFILSFVLVFTYLLLRLRGVVHPWVNKKTFLLAGVSLGLLSQAIWVGFFLSTGREYLVTVRSVIGMAGEALILTSGLYFVIGRFKGEKLRFVLTAVVCAVLFVFSLIQIRGFILEYQSISTPRHCNELRRESAFYPTFYKYSVPPCISAKE